MSWVPVKQLTLQLKFFVIDVFNRATCPVGQVHLARVNVESCIAFSAASNHHWLDCMFKALKIIGVYKDWTFHCASRFIDCNELLHFTVVFWYSIALYNKQLPNFNRLISLYSLQILGMQKKRYNLLYAKLCLAQRQGFFFSSATKRMQLVF